MEIKERIFGETSEGKFTLTETMERTYSIDIEKALIKLKEVEGEINKIPKQIEGLEAQRLELIKFYNEGVAVLREAKEHYKGEYDELEIPENK